MLVILDCDDTLWNHPDVPSTKQPYTKADENTLIDIRGEQLRLNLGARDFLERLEV